MFTTKYSKNRSNYSGKSKKKGLKFQDGGAVPLPRADPRANDMLDERGNPAGENWSKLSTKQGWKDQARRERQNKMDYDASFAGSSGRSFGEHAKAAARAAFEGTKFREREEAAGARDRTNPLYDRKKAKEEED